MAQQTRYVVDASVALKWFLREEDEADAAQALALLESPPDQPLLSPPFVQPVHFIAEVAAVLARLKPADVHADLSDLQALDFQIADSAAIYDKAIELARQFDQHVFDTLYHAVALDTPGGVLVTADKRYFRKAASAGRIVMLDQLSLH